MNDSFRRWLNRSFFWVAGLLGGVFASSCGAQQITANAFPLDGKHAGRLLLRRGVISWLPDSALIGAAPD